MSGMLHVSTSTAREDWEGSWAPCRDGHTVTWCSSSTADAEPPEGHACDCGRMAVAYEVCPVCGTRRMVLRPVEAR